MNINYSMIDGYGTDLATGGVVAIVAILMVFLVLMLIIVLTELASKAINSAVKEEAPAKETPANTPAPVSTATPLDINDTDATVAALVASIDYREETGMNIRVVSVKKVG